MVLGLNRTRLRSDVSGLFAVRPMPIKLVQPGDWAVERGSVLFESNADLLGGFPGYADRGGRFEGARFAVTDRFILVDEGQPFGFGLPLRWVEGTAQVSYPGKSDTALRIFYRESGTPRSFTVRFGASRLGSRGVSRAARVQHILHSTGLEDRFSAELPAEPNFGIPWEQSREFEHENAIWTGRASAPLQVGCECIASDVWLTTRSLIWGGGAGSGLNRIPLTLLMDLVSTRLKDRMGTPAVYLSIGDAHTGRFEMPFIFDLNTPLDRNFRERGAFVVGLKSRGLPEGRPAPIWQPWRPDPALMAAEAELETVTEVSNDAETEIDAIVPDERGLANAMIRRARLTASPPLIIDDEPAPVVDHVLELDFSEISPAPVEAATQVEPVAPLLADEPWFVDEGSPTIPVLAAETPLEAADGATIEVDPIDAALEEVEVERDPTEKFQVLNPDFTAALGSAVDTLLSEWSAAETVPVDQPVEATPVEPVVEAADSVVSSAIQRPEPMDRVIETPAAPNVVTVAPKTGERWAAVKKYEEAAVGALAEALRVIDDRVAGNRETRLSEAAPSSLDQANAIAEITTMSAQSQISGDEAKAKRDRLMSLGDVSVRLRTLVELFDTDFLTSEELEAKRSKLVKQLSGVLLP